MLLLRMHVAVRQQRNRRTTGCDSRPATNVQVRHGGDYEMHMFDDQRQCNSLSQTAPCIDVVIN
jgi:hypothetical protein